MLRTGDLCLTSIEPRINKCQRKEQRQSTTPISVANDIPSMRPKMSPWKSHISGRTSQFWDSKSLTVTSCSTNIRPKLRHGILRLFHFICISIFNQVDHKWPFGKVFILKFKVRPNKTQPVPNLFIFWTVGLNNIDCAGVIVSSISTVMNIFYIKHLQFTWLLTRALTEIVNKGTSHFNKNQLPIVKCCHYWWYTGMMFQKWTRSQC